MAGVVAFPSGLSVHLNRALFLIPALLVWCAAAPRVASAPAWRWSNPQPHGNNIAGLAYGPGLVAQATERGQIYTSDDLELWAPRESGTTNALRAVIFFGSRLIASGENATIVSGTDPANLETIDLKSSDWLEGLAASTNLAVAVGDNGAIYTSNDGVGWTRRTTPFTNWLRGAAYGGGRFLAVGEGGLIASSTNGIAWRVENSGTSVDLNDVAWLTDRFWVVGDGGKVLTNTLAGNWRSVTSPATNDLFAVAGLPGLTLVVGDNELRLRDNASATWANQFRSATPAPAWTYYCAAAQGDTVIVGGRTGVVIEGARTNSTIRWFGPTPSVRNWLWSVWRAPDFYVAVGDHATVLTSEGGHDWDVEFVPESLTNNIFLGVGGNSNLLVAAGNQGSLMISRNVRTNVVSTNSSGVRMTNSVSLFGVAWDAVEPRPAQNDLQGVAATEELVVVTGGKGKVFTSGDGLSWFKQNTPTTNFLSGAAFFSGGWVVVGDLGTILSSPDATNWAARASGTVQWIYQVRNCGGLLIAVGQNGTVLTSTDGVQWLQRNSGTAEWLNDAAWVGTNYFLAGTKGTVLMSSDAVHWSSIGTITFKSLYGLAASAGQLIAAGIEGVILRSQIIPLSSPVNFQSFSRATSATAGEISYNIFLFSGQPDQTFFLERTDDLAAPQWSAGPRLELFETNGTLLYVEPGIREQRSEFFRTRLTTE